MGRVTGAVLVPEAANALAEMGRRLRRARLRRNMTIEDVARRIGVHRETLSNMETGSPNASVGTLMGALWVYGLLPGAGAVADADEDHVGRALDAEERRRARPADGGMNNDF